MTLPAIISENPEKLISALLDVSNKQSKDSRQLARTINTLYATKNNNQGAEAFFSEDKFEKFIDMIENNFNALGLRFMSGMSDVSEQMEKMGKSINALGENLTKDKEEEKKNKKADYFWQEDKEKAKVKREEAQIGVLEKILKQMGNQSLDFLFDGLSEKIGFNEKSSSLGGGLTGGLMGSLLTSLGLGGFKNGMFRGSLGLAKKFGLGRLFVKSARLGKMGLTGLGFVAKRLPFLAAMYAMYGAAEGLWNIDDFAGKDGVKGNRTARKVVSVATSGILSKVLEIVSFGFIDINAKSIFPIVDTISGFITGGIESVWKTVDTQIESWLGQNYKDFKVDISRKYAGFMEGAEGVWSTLKGIFTGGEWTNPFSSKMNLQSDVSESDAAALDAMDKNRQYRDYDSRMKTILDNAKAIASKDITKNPFGEPIEPGYCARATKTSIFADTGKYPTLKGKAIVDARDMVKFYQQEGWPEIDMQRNPEAIKKLPEGFFLVYDDPESGRQHSSITAGKGMEYSDRYLPINSLMSTHGIPRVFKMKDQIVEPPMTVDQSDEKMNIGVGKQIFFKQDKDGKFVIDTESAGNARSQDLNQAKMKQENDKFDMTNVPVTIITETNNNNINQTPTTWETSMSSSDFYFLSLLQILTSRGT